MKNGALEAFAQKALIKNLPNLNIHKNGNHILLETNGTPILDEKGNLIGYRGADTDITLREKTEEELKKRAEELENINKLMVGRELKMIEMKQELERLRNNKN